MSDNKYVAVGCQSCPTDTADCLYVTHWIGHWSLSSGSPAPWTTVLSAGTRKPTCSASRRACTMDGGAGTADVQRMYGTYRLPEGTGTQGPACTQISTFWTVWPEPSIRHLLSMSMRINEAFHGFCSNWPTVSRLSQRCPGCTQRWPTVVHGVVCSAQFMQFYVKTDKSVKSVRQCTTSFRVDGVEQRCLWTSAACRSTTAIRHQTAKRCQNCRCPTVSKRCTEWHCSVGTGRCPLGLRQFGHLAVPCRR